MPNLDIPPTENVRSNLIRTKRPFVQRFVEAEPSRHEVEYMKRVYSFEEFQYVTHQAYGNSWRRDRFLLLHFSEARWKAGKQIGAHVTVAILLLIFFLG